jgi:diguanylate cyclase (GGDEF)-like protein
VQQISPALEPEPSDARIGSLLHPRRWLANRHPADQDRSALVFGMRLLATVALTFALVGVAGYVLLDRNAAQRQIANYAATQRADGRAFEHYGADEASAVGAIGQINGFLDVVAQRPGTLEAVLIGPDRVVRAAVSNRLEGTTDVDPRLAAVLAHGTSFAGRDSSSADHRNFEFIVPVSLPGGRYAYEVTYDHRTYDAQLNQVRRIIILIGLLALIGGGAVFYLVGGRRLMRDHRMVLRRTTRDGLTDLPNERAFQDEFPQAVASAARYEEPFAMALLDIDAFKRTNDRFGHTDGDSLLKRVATILRETRPGDRPYRIGGDEFALLLAHTGAEGARTLARRLSQDLTGAGIDVSIGVSALRRGLQADTLHAEADAALYDAKRRGGKQVAHFDDIRDRVVVTTSEKKEAVRRLIEEGRLTTVFQPIWDFDAEALLGVEALARPDQSYGFSGPAEAFDIAEQIGMVYRLDLLCVESALRSAPALHAGVLLFINLSPQTLDLDAETGAWLAPAVERAGLEPKDVVVEVTERFGGRTASVVKRLKRLHEQGFKIAIDDVGTGNSGLDILSKIAAEFVKLDRSIVVGAATESSARAVLMAMATFARQTGAFVIAEGIEDAETLQFLRSIDDRDLSSHAIIQGGQGFGLGRPSPEPSAETPAMLHDSRAMPAAN